jgi:hypothetical protein
MTPPHIEWKINVGHVITLAVLLIGIIAGYASLQAREETVEQRMHEHQAYNDRRFDAVATKESRAARDQEVNARLDMIAKRLDEMNARLERNERIHMKNSH